MMRAALWILHVEATIFYEILNGEQSQIHEILLLFDVLAGHIQRLFKFFCQLCAAGMHR